MKRSPFEHVRRWGPLGVSVFTALMIAFAFAIYFGAPEAIDEVTPGPGIPPFLADHRDRGEGLERGETVGAAPSKAIPRPVNYLAERGISFTFYGSPNWSGRGTNPIEAIVLHVTGPGTCPGMRSWFNNPASQVSAHFGVCKDGKVEGYVEVGDVAWHAGIVNRPDLSNPLIASWVATGINPNLRHVGIELLLAGPAEPLSEYPQMKASLFALLRWLSQELGIPLDRTHVIGHYQIDGVNRQTDPRCCLDIDALLFEMTGGAPSTLPPPTGMTYWDAAGERWRFPDGWSFDPDDGCGRWFDATDRLAWGECDTSWGGRYNAILNVWTNGTSTYHHDSQTWWAGGLVLP